MLPTASPESVGIASERLQVAFTHLRGWLAEGAATAIASVVVRHGRIAGEFYGGKVAPAPDAKPVTAGTLFHIASIGKPMTATAVMQLVESGKVSLDDPVAAYVPKFSGEWRDGITVRHLLTHTSGLPQDPGPEILEGIPAGSGTAVFLANYHRTRLAVPTASKVEYSNVGYGMLGLIIEAASGMPFPAYMRERVLAPLDMKDAWLAPAESLYPRIAHVGGVPEPGSLTERFNSAYARTVTNPAGSVIAAAADVASFFQMFLSCAPSALSGGANSARSSGRSVISPAAARLMTTNHTAGLRGGIEGFMTWDDCAWGLGFDLRGSKRPHFSGEFTSARTFGHSGVAGTFAWADPERDLVCVMLANRILHNLWNHPRWSRYSSAVVAALTD